jgi:hypothetical protein
MGLMMHWHAAIYFTTGNDSHTSWGMMVIGGILPGIVDYILHALHGRMNAIAKPVSEGAFYEAGDVHRDMLSSRATFL